MAMSDCERCWNTPCVCADAHNYQHLSLNEMTAIRDGLSALIQKRKKERPELDPDRRVHVTR